MVSAPFTFNGYWAGNCITDASLEKASPHPMVDHSLANMYDGGK